MTTPKAKFAGLALIVALCGGFISMSAFGGKADVNHCVGECPLLAISGHWRWVKSNRDLGYRDAGGGRHWSVAQEGYKQMRKAFGVTAEG